MGKINGTPWGACASVSRAAPLRIICARNKPASLWKSRHTPTQFADKIRPIGTQNRPPAYHETIPQPKLTLLQSCLHLKAEQCLWLYWRLFCWENLKEHRIRGSNNKKSRFISLACGKPCFWMFPPKIEGGKCGQETLLPEPLMCSPSASV